jgi:crossover junction endodeoxyribonuclease RusA
MTPPLESEEQRAVTVTLPWPPKTGNHANGRSGKRMYRDKDLEQWRMAAQAQMRQDGVCVELTGRLEVVAAMYPPDKRRRDLDNVWKVVGDALSSYKPRKNGPRSRAPFRGVYGDDSQIDDLRLIRVYVSDRPVVVVEVRQLEALYGQRKG